MERMNKRMKKVVFNTKSWLLIPLAKLTKRVKVKAPIKKSRKRLTNLEVNGSYWVTPKLTTDSKGDRSEIFSVSPAMTAGVGTKGDGLINGDGWGTGVIKGRATGVPKN